MEVIDLRKRLVRRALVSRFLSRAKRYDEQGKKSMAEKARGQAFRILKLSANKIILPILANTIWG